MDYDLTRKAKSEPVSRSEFISALSYLKAEDLLIGIIKVLRVQFDLDLKLSKALAYSFLEGNRSAGSIWDEYRPLVVRPDDSLSAIVTAYDKCINKGSFGTARRILINAVGLDVLTTEAVFSRAIEGESISKLIQLSPKNFLKLSAVRFN